MAAIAYSLLALDKQRSKATDAVSKHRSLFTSRSPTGYSHTMCRCSPSE